MKRVQMPSGGECICEADRLIEHARALELLILSATELQEFIPVPRMTLVHTAVVLARAAEALARVDTEEAKRPGKDREIGSNPPHRP